MDLINREEWHELEKLSVGLKKCHLKDVFQSDEHRISRMSYRLGSIYVDFSKNRVTKEVMGLLNTLAEGCQVKEWTKKMFAGEKINYTEERAVLHIALRNVLLVKGLFEPLSVVEFDGQDVMQDVCKVLNQMAKFVNAVRSGSWLGATDKKITKIVNIGIGGSDLGPKMIVRSLRPYCKEDLEYYFVSNVDGSDIDDTLKKCDPETTLFVIASKTFTTQETMQNANTAKEWFLKLRKKEDIAKHFVAASTAKEKVSEFGISNMFPFWDWVGGRYSAPSAVGLSVMLAIGVDNFAELLSGYQHMDQHFLKTDIEDNIPVQMALLGIWYNNFLGAESKIILPYDQRLEYFAAYFQQGDMESNGKFIDREGRQVSDYQTGPIIWGEPGTNGQHAFFQLIHQGTKLIPADFIACKKPNHSYKDHHDKLIANFIAQPEALMNGKTEVELQAEGCPKSLIPHKTFLGNRPTTSILLDELSPKALGMLIAMYEHTIFTQGIIWNINSFDQYGVELGKVLAKNILTEIEQGSTGNHDPSTTAMLKEFLS